MKLDRDILRKLPLALRVEIEENALRKALTQSELAIEQRRILKELRKHLQPGERTDLTAESTVLQMVGNVFPEVEAIPEPQVRATDIVGKLFGESRKQVERRQAIVMAAEAEPEEYGKLVDDMDRTGRVNGVFRRLKNSQQAAIIKREAPPLPMLGPYRVITCDVPWPYEVRDEDPSKRGVRPYPSMSIEAIKAFGQQEQVQKLLHDDCIMWFWTTNYHMRFAFDVLDAWGLDARTILTWVKNRMGNGDWLRSQTEHCIMAVRGRPTVTLTNQTTVLHAPMRAHSQKPREFYDMVERLCPAPRYCDLFSRYRHNSKWDVHGDQAPALSTKSESPDPKIEASPNFNGGDTPRPLAGSDRV